MRTHFQSQPIPHIGAWYSQQLPDFTKDLLSACTMYVETVLPLMIYFPIRCFRRWSFILQASLMLGIMVTGNYNFFNILAVAIGTACLDDEALQNMLPNSVMDFLGLKVAIDESELTPQELSQKQGEKRSLFHKIISKILSRNSLCILSFWGLNGYLFYLIFLTRGETGEIQINREYQTLLLPFNTAEYLNILILWVLISAAISFILSYKRMSQIHRPGSFKSAVIHLIFGGFFFISGFILSVPYFAASLGHKTESLSLLKPIADTVLDIQYNIRGLHIGNSYGLFRSMTGLNGTPVMVIQALVGPIEGEGQLNWKEIEIEGKLGHLGSMPGIYNPCQKRVPWQLWFSALEENPLTPHFLHLLHKIYFHNEDFSNMIKVAHQLEPNNPASLAPISEFHIKELKVNRYLYNMTDADTFGKTGAYWTRKLDKSFEELKLNKMAMFQIETFLVKAGLLNGPNEGRNKKHPMKSYFDWIEFC